MSKKVILLAVAVIAFAVLNFRTDATSSGKSGQPGVLDDVTAKMVLLLQKDGGGPAAVQGKADVKDSPYFKKIDIYNFNSIHNTISIIRNEHIYLQNSLDYFLNTSFNDISKYICCLYSNANKYAYRKVCIYLL